MQRIIPEPCLYSSNGVPVLYVLCADANVGTLHWHFSHGMRISGFGSVNTL